MYLATSLTATGSPPFRKVIPELAPTSWNGAMNGGGSPCAVNTSENPWTTTLTSAASGLRAPPCPG